MLHSPQKSIKFVNLHYFSTKKLKSLRSRLPLLNGIFGHCAGFLPFLLVCVLCGFISFWGSCVSGWWPVGVDWLVGSMCMYSGSTQISTVGYSGSTLALLWEYSGTTLGVPWDYCASILGVLPQYSGSTAPVLWEYCTSTLGLPWEYCASTLGVLYQYSGSTAPVPWDYPGSAVPVL